MTRESMPRVLVSMLALAGITACNAAPLAAAQEGSSDADTGENGSTTEDDDDESSEDDESTGDSADSSGAATGDASGSTASETTEAGPDASESEADSTSASEVSGSTTEDPAAHDHCIHGHHPHPSDALATMRDGPADFYPPGNMDPAIVDTTVQPEVLDYMYENSWQVAHIEWHAIRACNIPGGGGSSKVDICRFTQLIPENQNCQTAGDGYEFLVFHRHMIHALKQLWPNHSEQFTGFETFPDSADDVPEQWRSAWRDWDPEILEAGRIGDNIADPANLALFPDEGALGFWLQCNVGQRLSGATNMPWVGLHFVLHAKWARPGNTTHGVNNTEANIDNYMFWKLHGWIDNVWEKYRLAKGLQPDDPQLVADMTASCHEMDRLIDIIENDRSPEEVPDPELPEESGVFHEQVRPIFESQTNLCSGCHAEAGANAMLTLGGHVSSRDIVEGLVNVASRGGGQYKLVVPGDPDNSWLYLKAAGLAEAAGCELSSTAQCMTGVMPPGMGDPTVTPAELQILRQWIQDGAEGPP